MTSVPWEPAATIKLARAGVTEKSGGEGVIVTFADADRVGSATLVATTLTETPAKEEGAS